MSDSDVNVDVTSTDNEKRPTPPARVYGLAARVDPTVTFEEFRYWAKLQRAEEREENLRYIEEQGPMTLSKMIKNRFSHGIHHERKKKEQKEAARREALQVTAESNGEQEQNPKQTAREETMTVTEEEWKTASRALKTAGWGSVFYLITTDILGWETTAFVFSSVGFGPGVALYIIFGCFAALSGWILWRVFLGLDSAQYPMVSFGDTYFRVYGRKARHFINVAQSLQQFMTVAVLILSNGIKIAQLSKREICFIVCMIIFMVAGMMFGSIRSLQHIGWFANVSVWVNIISFIIIMVASANFGIDYAAVTRSTLIKEIGPVRTFAGPPPDQYQQQAHGFAGQFNGVNQMVYSYGGALLFVAFMAEMRHPWDFWKGLLCAQVFICLVYLFFGAFVYGHYGQYSVANLKNVIQPRALQIVCNSLGLITASIACLMYFNVGMKTVYIEVFQEAFKFPPITTRKGRWMWYALGPVYWVIAFLVSASVPNLNGISGLVGALLILNFTYTFPAFLYIGFRCQTDAALPGEGFDPATGVTTRLDGGWRRWLRGYKKSWPINTLNLFYGLGGLVCSGMGAWAAIEGLKQVFGPGGTVATSFGCEPPV
ncbi:amino acid transporter [Coccidioides immitis RS]|uniref:Amino acid transporter n=3 Tax=Coccidioides immitis TaxID=5501 RepID=J3K9G2_COCIM|nr:amino acid transporter [Coccidioides immitis RS]EAS31534.3 amino acid transporter [Coccidioides immitis RS]KMP04176.1 hypothetical protein CIRG_03867 [Coccidioides immitis RMSCC 2394]TPX24303.1 hypothetical protein DIZ76_013649 [Coccidioides immitis]